MVFWGWAEDQAWQTVRWNILHKLEQRGWDNCFSRTSVDAPSGDPKATWRSRNCQTTGTFKGSHSFLFRLFFSFRCQAAEWKFGVPQIEHIEQKHYLFDLEIQSWCLAPSTSSRPNPGDVEEISGRTGSGRPVALHQDESKNLTGHG